MSCNTKYIPKTIFIGSEGPQGPQGPPGPGGSREDFLPWLTSEIQHDGNESTGEMLSNIIDAILYIALSIDAFNTSTPVYEKGQSISALTFNWALNKTIQSQSIDGPGYSSGALGVAVRSVAAAVSPAITSDSTYEITAGDGTNVETREHTVLFQNKAYWGARTSATINSAFILSLANNTLTNNKSRTINVNAGSSQYIYYAYPKSLGTAIFSVGGFEGGFEAPVEVSFTNSQGFTEDYYVYRSTNANLGNTTVIVS